MKPTPSESPLKRYYTIGEVADMFDVSKSLIRFWESEFDWLRPHKTEKGERRFTPRNIDQFRLIYHLVKERGFTLEGARQEIQRQLALEKERAEFVERLQSVRERLALLKDQLG